MHRTNDPVDIYLQKTSNPELCRKAVIRSAKDDITCLFVDSMVLEIIDENQPDSREGEFCYNFDEYKFSVRRKSRFCKEFSS